MALLDARADADLRIDGAILIAMGLADLAFIRRVFVKLDLEGE